MFTARRENPPEAVHFLKRTNEICYERFPGAVTIAEESTAWFSVQRVRPILGGLGFGMKWNAWAGCTTSSIYMALDPIFRRFHHNSITFSIMYAFSEHFVLVLSHDEVVHGKRSLLGKMPGDEWQQQFGEFLRLFYAWMQGHPGKKLVFMGQ